MKKFVFLFLATWLYGDMKFDVSRNDLTISDRSEAGYLLSELKELVVYIGKTSKASLPLYSYDKGVAQNISNWLISKGINARKIINHFIEGNELNKRVEFIFSNIK